MLMLKFINSVVVLCLLVSLGETSFGQENMPEKKVGCGSFFTTGSWAFKFKVLDGIPHANCTIFAVSDLGSRGAQNGP
jgi:hypothetical protein